MSGHWCQLSTQVDVEYQQIHLNIGMGRADQERMKEAGEVIRPGENLDAQHSLVLTKFKTRTEHRVNIGQTDQVRWYSTSTRVRSAAEILGETTVATKRCALNRPQKIDRLASMMSIFTIEPGEIIPSGTTLNDILKVDREEGRLFRRGHDVKHMENQTGYEGKLATDSHFDPSRAITKDTRTKQNKNKGVTTINMTHSKELVQEITSSVGGKRASMDATQTTTSLKTSGLLEGLNVKTGEKIAMSINTSIGNEGVSVPLLKVSQNSETNDMSLRNNKFKVTDDNNNGSKRVIIGGADLDSCNTSRESDDVFQKDRRGEMRDTTIITAEPRANHASTAKSSESVNTAEKPGKPPTTAKDGQNEVNTLRQKTDDLQDKTPTNNSEQGTVGVQGSQDNMLSDVNCITCKGKDDPQIQESAKLIGQNLKGILKKTPKTESTKPLECPTSVGKELRRILKPTRMNRFDLMEKPGFIDRYFVTWEKLAIIKALKDQQVKRKTQQSYCGAEVCNEKENGSKQIVTAHEDSSDSDNAIADDLPRDKEKGQSGRHDLPPHCSQSNHGPQKGPVTNSFNDGDSDSDCAIAEDLPQDQYDNAQVLQSAKRLPGKQENGRDTISSCDNDSESDCAKAEDLPLDCEHNAWSRKQVKQTVKKKDAAESKRSKQQVAGKATIHRGTDDSNLTRTAQVQQDTSQQSPDSDDETFSENAQTISWSGSDSDCDLVEDLPFDHDISSQTEQLETQVKTKRDTRPNERDTRPNERDTRPNEIDTRPNERDTRPNERDTRPNERDTHPNERHTHPNERDTDPNDRDTHLDKRHTHPNERKTRPHERDTHLDERYTHPNEINTRPHVRDRRPTKRDTQLDKRHTHPNKRNTRLNERDTCPKERDAHPNERDTRQKERETRPNERHRCLNERDKYPQERATRPNDRHTRHCDREMAILERISAKSKRHTKEPDLRSTVDSPGRTGLFSRKVSQNSDRLFGRDELSEYLDPPFNPYHGVTVVDLRSQNPVDVYSQRCHENRKNIYSTIYPLQHNETGHRTQSEDRPEVKMTIGLNLSRSHKTPHQGKLSRIMRSIRGKIKNLKETFCGCLT